jgi:hypothetical protein
MKPSCSGTDEVGVPAVVARILIGLGGGGGG